MRTTLLAWRTAGPIAVPAFTASYVYQQTADIVLELRTIGPYGARSEPTVVRLEDLPAAEGARYVCRFGLYETDDGPVTEVGIPSTGSCAVGRGRTALPLLLLPLALLLRKRR